MSTTLNNFFKHELARNLPLVITSSVVTTLAVTITLARLAFTSTSPPPKQIISSPRETLLPRLSKEEQELLAYPPDVFPGARDVSSPYGTIRVYEWGPEEGKKVLLIHGISTPCLSLGRIANGLIEKGCRVMLLDLFGRGYSDGVADLPHDSRLYSSQILIAVTSSILPWATEGFALIGYSLGGGIVVDFSTAFPSMVSGVVLLAPAGLIRRGHFGWMSRLLYSGLVPGAVVEGMIRRRLRGGVVPRSTDKVSIKSPENAVNAEIKGTEFESVELSKSRPGVTVAKAVQWQLFEHKGFVRSFVSSIMFASIAGTEEMKGGWRVLGAQRKERGDKVLVIAGARDNVIVEKELGEDVLECVGEENLEWRVIDGAGHEFPMTRAEEVVGMVSEVWGL